MVLGVGVNDLRMGLVYVEGFRVELHQLYDFLVFLSLQPVY